MAEAASTHLYQLVPVFHRLARVSQHLCPVFSTMRVGSLWTHAAHPDHFIVADAGDWENDYWKGQAGEATSYLQPRLVPPHGCFSPVIVYHCDAETHVLHALRSHVEHQGLVVCGV